MKIKRICLNPIEATSYWWIKEIRSKIREINSLNDGNDNEIEFIKLFSDFTDIEWRKLYLELNKYFSYKVECLSDMTGTKFYHQDTSLNHHNDLNEVLHIVLNRDIPDVSLNISNMEHSSICTNKYGADRVYNISGIVQLDTVYDYNYILSGDEKELEMQSLITYLFDLGFNEYSIDFFKKIFIDVYRNIHNDIDINVIEDDFDRIFNQLYGSDTLSFVSHQIDSLDNIDSDNKKILKRI